MRRAFSLLALGITIALTAAAPVPAPVLTLTSIKAVDSASEDKDQWSVKGYLSDPDADVISGIEDYGLEAELQDDVLDTLDSVTFDVDDCKVLNNNKGITCETSSARLSIRKTNKIPKALIAAQRFNNRTSPSASSYYAVSGVFRRREFQEDPVETPLTAVFIVDTTPYDDINTACTEKSGARTSRYSCKPGI